MYTFLHDDKMYIQLQSTSVTVIIIYEFSISSSQDDSTSILKSELSCVNTKNILKTFLLYSSLKFRKKMTSFSCETVQPIRKVQLYELID